MSGDPLSPDDALTSLRLWCQKDSTEGLEPHEVENLCEVFQNLDARLCNGGLLPTDWARPMPAGLRAVTQHWLDLLNERIVATEAANGELSTERMREFEDMQIDAALAVAESASCWLNNPKEKTTVTTTVDTHWTRYEACLDRIKDEGSTVADVIRICNEFFTASVGDAFFPGGGDRDLLGTLYEHGGWVTTQYDADYHYTVMDSNGAYLEYVEGDLYDLRKRVANA